MLAFFQRSLRRWFEGDTTSTHECKTAGPWNLMLSRHANQILVPYPVSSPRPRAVLVVIPNSLPATPCN